MSKNETIYTVGEVAEKLRVHRITIIRLIEKGELTGVRVGGQWRVWAKDFETYITRKTATGTDNG